jgi:hypothetical protein
MLAKVSYPRLTAMSVLFFEKNYKAKENEKIGHSEECLFKSTIR